MTTTPPIQAGHIGNSAADNEARNPKVTAKQLRTANSKLFFRALLANGLFSLATGLALVSRPTLIADYVGIADPRWLLGIGVGLVLFSGSLLVHVYRKRIARTEAIIISAMDLGWVIASLALVLFAPGTFSANGIKAVLVVAAIVFVFFEIQAFALWKIRKATDT